MRFKATAVQTGSKNLHANCLATWLQPMIKTRPWTTSRLDIPPSYHTRNRTEFRAIGIANPTSNNMRNSKPCSGDRQRPGDSRNRKVEKKPCECEASDTGDCSRHPLTACDCVRKARILTNRALPTVGHLHRRCLHITKCNPVATVMAYPARTVLLGRILSAMRISRQLRHSLPSLSQRQRNVAANAQNAHSTIF